MSEILDILERTGVILTDSHFVLTSGRHAPTYFNKDSLYLHTGEVSRVGRLLAEKCQDLDVDVVVGPAMGGIILSQWTAYHLSDIKQKDILAVYTEKTAEGNQVFTRGYDKVVKEKNILALEDLTSTGGSVKKAITSVQEAGGKVAAVCVMINRNPKEVTEEYFGVPFRYLDNYEVPSYEEAVCPLCVSGVPINTMVGHGKKYLAAKVK